MSTMQGVVENRASTLVLPVILSTAAAMTLLTILYDATQLAAAEDPVVWPSLAAGQALDSALWLAAVPVVLRTVRRFPLAGPAWPARLAVQAGACFGLGLACSVLFFVVVGIMDAGGLVIDHAVDLDDELMRMALLFCLAQLLVRPPAAAPRSEADVMPPDILVFRDGSRRCIQPVCEILWIEAQGNYLRLHTTTGRRLMRGTMRDLCARLGEDFVRTHRGVIVNRRAVRRVDRLSGGRATILLDDGATLPVGRAYADRLRAWMEPACSSPA